MVSNSEFCKSYNLETLRNPTNCGNFSQEQISEWFLSGSEIQRLDYNSNVYFGISNDKLAILEVNCENGAWLKTDLTKRDPERLIKTFTVQRINDLQDLLMVILWEDKQVDIY